MKQQKQVREDLHHAERECQRDLLHETLLNPVPGRNLEGLHDRPVHHNHEELECQRSAPQALLNSVLGVNLADLPPSRRHDRLDELECPWSVCLAVRCCREEKYDRKHFPTNCSALRERRHTERCETLSRDILGTAITCSTSAGASIFRKRSTTRSPNCGTRTSRIGTKGTMSSMCTAVCRRSPCCGRTLTRSAGQAASTSPSSNKLKYTVLGALEGRVIWPVAL